MAEYISKEDAIKVAEKYGTTNGSALGTHSGVADCIAVEIYRLPDYAVVNRTAYDQATFERDTALQQLKSIGKGLGERMDDVATVVRCKDCCHSYDDIGGLTCSYGPCVDCIVPEDFYCKHGERTIEGDK